MASNSEYEQQRFWVRKARNFAINPKTISAVDVTAELKSFEYKIKDKINIKPSKQ